MIYKLIFSVIVMVYISGAINAFTIRSIQENGKFLCYKTETNDQFAS